MGSCWGIVLLYGIDWAQRPDRMGLRKRLLNLGEGFVSNNLPYPTFNYFRGQCRHGIDIYWKMQVISHYFHCALGFVTMMEKK